MILKRYIPWWTKIPAKIVLSRVPVGYRLWQALNLFKHGQMESPAYALGVFETHYGRTPLAGRSGGFVGLEIGPGDTLSSAIIAKAFGASKYYLLDVESFARKDLEPYQQLIRVLADRYGGSTVEGLAECTSLRELLVACKAEYMTDAIASFEKIPDHSVDFIFSQAVLEHIRRRDFDRLVREMKRILKLDGICSHEVDLQDHLSGKLDNLRFSERVWESDFMARSGFYTNRIRFGEMLCRFAEGGFQYEVLRTGAFARVPTPRRRMAPQFRGLPDEDLCVSNFDVVLKNPVRNGLAVSSAGVG